jgi:transcription antitermination factor NusG
MQTNWYAVYTKPKCEKKVAAMLTKRKIENYVPLNFISKDASKKQKEQQIPLFESLIFVKIAVNNINEVKKLDNIISFLHLMEAPAIINENEIIAVKEFVHQYQNVEVQKSVVDVNDQVKNISEPVKSIDGKIYSINCKVIKVNLPSLGYIITAEADSTKSLEVNKIQRKRRSIASFLNL